MGRDAVCPVTSLRSDMGAKVRNGCIQPFARDLTINRSCQRVPGLSSAGRQSAGKRWWQPALLHLQPREEVLQTVQGERMCPCTFLSQQYRPRRRARRIGACRPARCKAPPALITIGAKESVLFPAIQN